MAQHSIGNRGHLIEVIAARVEHGQLSLAHVLGIIPRVAICQLHMTLHREQISEQTASQHDDQSGVREMNAEFPPVPAEAFYVRSDKVNQQHSSDEMAPGKIGIWNPRPSGGHHTNMLWK